MNTHMINQILPFLLTESTPQGIPQKDTVITILTRHPSLNPRKLTERHPQEQVKNIIIHQAVIILPISKDHVKDRRNNDLVGHSCNKPVRHPHRSSHPTSEVAKHRQLLRMILSHLSCSFSFPKPEQNTEASIHIPPYFSKTANRSKSQKDAAGISPFLYFLTTYSGSSTHSW